MIFLVKYFGRLLILLILVTLLTEITRGLYSQHSNHP